MCIKVHKEALMALRAFWMVLLSHDVTLIELVGAVRKIDSSIRAADKTYKTVMQKHAHSIIIVRLYGRWLEEVKHNPWGAQRWYG